MVPINPTTLMIDLIEALGLPVILVARPTLGGINHALLSITQLQARSLPLAGMVFNRTMPPGSTPNQVAQEQSTVQLTKEFTEVPVFGPLPYISGMSKSWNRGMEQLLADPSVQELVTRMMPMPRSVPEPPR